MPKKTIKPSWIYIVEYTPNEVFSQNVHIYECDLLNNGYKDLFVEESKSEYINITPIQAYQAARS